MDCTFVVGQKVVALGTFNYVDILEEWPIKDNVYTVRDICSYPTGIFLRFKEVINIPKEWGDGNSREASFSYKWFKPLIEKEIDISIFIKILDDCNEDKKFGDEFKRQIEIVKRIKELEVLQ